MKSIPAIVEPAFDADLVAEQVIVALADLRNIDSKITRVRGQLDDAMGAAKARRFDLGRWLSKAREAWPERGPNAKGWGEFCTRVKIAESTARMYIAEYRDPKGFAEKASAQRKENESGPEVAPALSLVPDAEPEVEIDRDTWCTPRWITETIGTFDMDPCSNARSTVNADIVFRLEDGEDGLVDAASTPAEHRVFINPPYSDVPPWIAAYGHTRFCFLLKLDTSTRWFADLIARTELILIPRKRVQFEPPPGVPPERAIAQQFPHALFYAHGPDATLAIRKLCWIWRVDRQAI